MKRAIIVADMLNEFVTGRLGSVRARKIVPSIKKLLEKARKQGIPVIYYRDVHTPEDREMKIWGQHAMKGTEASEIIPELKPEKMDIVIEKRWYCGFVNTNLQEILKKMGIDTLIYTGVSTDICVQNDVAFAYFSGYNTTILSDCTASIEEEAHEYALKYMKKIYGSEITTSDKVL